MSNNRTLNRQLTQIPIIPASTCAYIERLLMSNFDISEIDNNKDRSITREII